MGYLCLNLPNNLNSLQYIAKNIDDWYRGNKSTEGYTSCSVALEKNSQILKQELKSGLEDLVNSFWQKTSIRESRDFLRKLENLWLNSIAEFEQKKQECLLKERGCLDVYNERVLAMDGDDDENNLERNYGIAKKALMKIYNLKLKAEIYSRASQALEMIMRSNQLYLNDLDNAYFFLTEIRENLLSGRERTGRTLLPLLFEQMSRQINLDDLRKEMEQALGHSLQKWGTYGGISAVEVQHILLLKLNPITQKIVAQMYDQLGREFKKKETWVNDSFVFEKLSTTTAV